MSEDACVRAVAAVADRTGRLPTRYRYACERDPDDLTVEAIVDELGSWERARMRAQLFRGVR